ncbi:MAG: hypothetical protein ACOYUZ_05735 [Patescibacteria group bacterium]
MIKRTQFVAPAIFLILLTGLIFATPASAASSPIDLESLSEMLNLSDKDPRAIAAELINVFISFLAVIFVVLILHAGFLFMISGGDKEKTAKARRAIANAIIGLAIVLSSWAITTFAIDAITNALAGGQS